MTKTQKRKMGWMKHLKAEAKTLHSVYTCVKTRFGIIEKNKIVFGFQLFLIAGSLSFKFWVKPAKKWVNLLNVIISLKWY